MHNKLLFPGNKGMERTEITITRYVCITVIVLMLVPLLLNKPEYMWPVTILSMALCTSAAIGAVVGKATQKDTPEQNMPVPEEKQSFSSV